MLLFVVCTYVKDEQLHKSLIKLHMFIVTEELNTFNIKKVIKYMLYIMTKNNN